VLRVCNDDLVQPARGFGTHPHANAEIATYIVSGALTHADSMGTSDTLERGGVQFMTAGRGVRHSERNASTSAPLRFIQLWFTPRSTGLPPNYGSFAGDAAARRDAWAHLVGDVADAKRQPPVKFNADANIYVTELSPGAVLTFPLAAGRQAYLLACEGDARVGGAHGADVQLATHDGAEVFGPSELRLTAGADGAHVLLIEMARSG
jgi:redox-sensitive bicupin YhaK (pirin superfamily)